MEQRYNKFVFEAEEGIVFEVSEGDHRELIIKALNRVVSANVYADRYDNPPIPEGYRYVCGEWNNGYVIERSADGSQFVWIPVGWLDANGTLNGEDYTEKFGRRAYQDDKFSDADFHEPMGDELQEQLESVKKYGGFYISRYNISKSADGKPQAVKGAMPWVDVNYNEAKALAAALVYSASVKSHLTYGAEYDCALEWLVRSGALDLKAIAEDSTRWGNHWNTPNGLRSVAQTGQCEGWAVNGIYDLAGNVDEWTQEQNGKSLYVIRGGNYYYDGIYCPVSYRCGMHYFRAFHNTGFRAALCIK